MKFAAFALVLVGAVELSLFAFSPPTATAPNAVAADKRVEDPSPNRLPPILGGIAVALGLLILVLDSKADDAEG